MMPGLGPRTVTQRLGERLAGVLERIDAFLGALLHRAAGVEAVLRIEVHVHGLRDDIRDHGLKRRDRGLLGRLQGRVEELLGNFLDDLPHDRTGRGGRRHGRHFGQSEGERRRCLSRDDFRCKDRQLGDHRDFHPDDESGRGVQGGGDGVRGATGVGEVARAARELLPRGVEAVDGVAGVLRQHIARRPDTLMLEILHPGGEIPPLLGGIHQLVLVRRGPVEPEHFKDPLKCVRQHQRHGLRSPGWLWCGQGRIKDGQFGTAASRSREMN
ncbi:hypothetical protein OG863_35085 [Streptomyces decoyicus]|uniref:Uncharacterized protein n=1 Tax=Streptomyces decoyicus TaxID=249567 RepID=A0ABZ1FS77_9ACTN|nr:hypothetical protein [Streptomyces decoyicus]WSB72760.1 hypothetical protein OG863_35085 [Streptomyces decoyicus]